MKSLITRFHQQRQRGYTLTELSIALAIVAVVIVGAAMAARGLVLSNSVNTQIRESAAFESKLQRQYIKQDDTLSANVNTLAPLGLWPSERTVKNTDGTWAIRGVITGTKEFVFGNVSTIANMGAKQGFIYILRLVPTAACAELVAGLEGVSYAVWIGPAADTDPTTGATPTATVVKAPEATALNMANLATSCDVKANSAVDISFAVRP